MKPRKQCTKCPWKVSTDPRDIPGGYCVEKHANLARTIATPGEVMLGGVLRIMACHETTGGRELPCVGWLVHQLGPGNNIPLRLAARDARRRARRRTVAAGTMRKFLQAPRTRLGSEVPMIRERSRVMYSKPSERTAGWDTCVIERTAFQSNPGHTM